ncbi:unnamed protein product [Calypogeia fissa]
MTVIIYDGGQASPGGNSGPGLSLHPDGSARQPASPYHDLGPAGICTAAARQCEGQGGQWRAGLGIPGITGRTGSSGRTGTPGSLVSSGSGGQGRAGGQAGRGAGGVMMQDVEKLRAAQAITSGVQSGDRTPQQQFCLFYFCSSSSTSPLLPFLGFETSSAILMRIFSFSRDDELLLRLFTFVRTFRDLDPGST